MKQLEIKLNESELKICEWLAKSRFANNRNVNVVDKKIGPQSCHETDLEGICGEFAICKILNLYPDMSIHSRSGGHDLLYFGKKIDVKTTKYKTGKLLAVKSKKTDNADIYVLLTGKRPSYTFAGWSFSHELLSEKNLCDLGYGHTYGLDQKFLRDYQSLIELCSLIH